MFYWLHLTYKDSFIPLPSLLLINTYQFSKVCPGLMKKYSDIEKKLMVHRGEMEKRDKLGDWD